MTSSRTVTEYKTLHASHYRPHQFLLEENIADVFFQSFADLDMKECFEHAGDDERTRLRALIVDSMLNGDDILCRANASPVLEIPCTTRRKRNGRVVEFLRYDFSAKKIYYGQTAQEDSSSDRFESLGVRLAQLEESHQQARTVITNVGAVTRSMKSSIDMLSKRVNQLFRRIDAADEFIKETVDYSQSIASAYAAWRFNERAGLCPARRPK